MTRLLLVHGGFAPAMTAELFWTRPGVTAGLVDAGFDVAAPDRAMQPCSWRDEGDHLASVIGEAEAVTVIAGSNGCSAAVRLATDHPGCVETLVLCWPATAGDPTADAIGRQAVADAGWPPEHADELFAGETLRGVRDTELAALTLPVAIVPSDPFNVPHQERTVTALLGLIAHATRLAAFPESPMSYFAPRKDEFVAALVSLCRADKTERDGVN